jgi:motility quorum-sensing regulator/GCU-specific mRNA interferase toxin
VPVTPSARVGASELGLKLAEMLALVMSLTSDDFYNSITTHADDTVWQEAYRPSSRVVDASLNLVVLMRCGSCLSRSDEPEMSCLRRSGNDPR